MNSYLVTHAKRHVWCTPDQDWQLRLAPARLTRINGAVNAAHVLWEDVSLPTRHDAYHLYQIGQLSPKRLGVQLPVGQWTSLVSHCNENHLIVDLYNDNGLQYPRCLAHLRMNKDRNVLLAVKIDDRMPFDLNRDTLYVRVYTNAFFESDRADPTLDFTYVRGEKITSVGHGVQVQNAYHQYLAKRGVAYAFVNGRFVNDLGPTTSQVGDVVEFVYDSTIKAVVDIPINGLPTFNSLLDLKRKYLLHYGGFDEDLIEYLDDIDFWVIRKQGGGKFTGVYYHKNHVDAVRMLTHRDYSIPVPYLSSYVTHNPELEKVNQTTLRLHLRHSGYRRPLVFEHHRIHELYKLPVATRRRALLGLDSVVPEWRADQLELSAYPRVMGSREKDITAELVEEAYGYNALSVALAQTPMSVVTDPTRPYVPLRVGLWEESTHYEYNVDGHLLGQYLHVTGDRYYPRNEDCVLVESVRGRTGLTLDAWYGNASVTLSPDKHYRFYRCAMVGGRPTEAWEDVTDTDAYQLVGDLCVWRHDPLLWYGQVRSDTVNLGYQFDLTRRDGLLVFSVLSTERHGEGTLTKPLYVPPGKFDLWLNGRALIENLDYVVHWPEVVIVNKSHLVAGTQRVVLRGMGFCDTTLAREVYADVGFVSHGELSRNDRFDLRDDRVMRVVVGGAVYQKDELVYAEDGGVVVPGVANGTPYVIDDILVPLREFAPTDTYTLRARSKAVDQRVSDYLSLKLPEVEKPTPNMIPERYAIYSPLCSKVMYDLQHGLLGGDALRQHYNDQDVTAWLADYLWLLKYDPTQDTNLPDANYVAVHPHNLLIEQSLDIYQYTFLERVVRLFLNNRVDLTRFITVGLPTT